MRVFVTWNPPDVTVVMAPFFFGNATYRNSVRTGSFLSPCLFKEERYLTMHVLSSRSSLYRSRSSAHAWLTWAVVLRRPRPPCQHTTPRPRAPRRWCCPRCRRRRGARRAHTWLGRGRCHQRQAPTWHGRWRIRPSPTSSIVGRG